MTKETERPLGLRRLGPAAPGWLRALAFVDRVYGGFAIARDELALSRLSALQWTSLVVERYEAAASFYGGANTAQGFAEDERALIQRWLKAPPARVLVPAAGAGREAFALVAMGYQVSAFDPARPLFSEMGDTAARLGIDLPVQLATFSDFADEALDRAVPGKLHRLLSLAPYDAVLLGLNSFSHLRTTEARVRLLRACRAVCPQGPVLATFYLEHVPMSRVRAAVRAIFGRLPGAQEVTPGDQLGLYGYEHAFSRTELETLAAAAGYEFSLLDAGFMPCGAFFPGPSSRETRR